MERVFIKRRSKENLHPVFYVKRNIATKGKENVEALNVFFASVFNRKKSISSGKPGHWTGRQGAE